MSRVAEAVDPKELTDALAHATSATRDLARATSELVARIGREVINLAVSAGPDRSVPPSLAENPAPDVLQDLGHRVDEGIKPLSGTARHAFGFLLGPALDAEE